MDKLMIFFGIAILAATWYELQRDEASTHFLFDWWVDAEISRQSNPTFYFALIVGQVLLGIGLIYQGVTGHEVVPFVE